MAYNLVSNTFNEQQIQRLKNPSKETQVLLDIRLATNGKQITFCHNYWCLYRLIKECLNNDRIEALF